MLSQFIEASNPSISFLEDFKFVVLSAHFTKAAVVSGCEAVNSNKNLTANTIYGFSESMMPRQYVEQ